MDGDPVDCFLNNISINSKIRIFFLRGYDDVNKQISKWHAPQKLIQLL